MPTILVMLLVASISWSVGYFTREVMNILKRIQKALYVLVNRAEKEEQKEKKMGFAGPLTMEEFREMEDEAKLNALNQE